jgi:hypothetical protein
MLITMIIHSRFPHTTTYPQNIVSTEIQQRHAASSELLAQRHLQCLHANLQAPIPSLDAAASSSQPCCAITITIDAVQTASWLLLLRATRARFGDAPDGENPSESSEPSIVHHRRISPPSPLARGSSVHVRDGWPEGGGAYLPTAGSRLGSSPGPPGGPAAQT